MLKFTNHPGSGYIRVICDICGGKYYRKDVTLVKDPFNTQHGLIVCKRDLDQLNEQALPNKIREGTVPSPELIRVEKADQFVANLNDDTAPSAPRYLVAHQSTVGSSIVLSWEGPEEPGSSGIIGYKVVRTVPLGAPVTISENSGTGATYYEDTTGDLSTYYDYKVAAINSFGTGPYSNIAHYPTFDPSLYFVWEYLLVSQNSNNITTGAGDKLLIRTS